MTDQARALTKDEQIAATLDTFGFVASWTCIAEIIDENGKRLLFNFAQPQQSNWTTAGLLAHAMIQNDVNTRKAIGQAR